MSVIGRFVRGAAAGVVGTVAMDLLWYARYRRGGGTGPFGEWEITRDVSSWDEAPAPALMARKLVETVTRREVPVERAAALANLMHWSYGVSWTAAYGLLVSGRGRRRPLWHGPAFGATVWSSDYVTLPLAGVYGPLWTYDAASLSKDLSAHLVFGAAADGALRLLAP
jgi:hypothetical protein